MSDGNQITVGVRAESSTICQVPSGLRLTVDDFARLTGLSAKTVHANIKRYSLPYRTFCGKHWIDTDELWAALPRGNHGEEGEETER